jgi:hypothetical protein
MAENLTVEFPSQGWRQILTSRKDILDHYDTARQRAQGQEVETLHGRVLEAEFRKWLQEFLPRKYGVAAGFVVSPGLKSSVKTPHFDTIIYDQLESPVLWVEDNPDFSSQGRSLAIPVEYVRAVLEVKASFSSSNVKEAIDHLADLSPVLNGIDSATDRYKLHLPPAFQSGLVFGEVRRTHMYSDAALEALIDGARLRGFFGGVILRAEGHTFPHTGRIALTRSDTPSESTLKDRQTPIGEYALSASREIAEKFHLGAMVMWSESNFAQFAFDLVAMLQGTYEPGRVSSFYGMGSSFHELMVETRSEIIPLKQDKD